MRTIITLLCILGVTIPAKAQFTLFRSYKPGYYYNLAGQKIIGLLSFEPYKDEIHFKESKDAKAQTIKITDLKAVISTAYENDSLAVLTEDGKDKKMYLGKLIVNTPGNKLYYRFKHANIGGVPTVSYGASPNINARGSQPSFTTTMTWSTSPMYSQTYTMPMYEENGTTHEIKKDNYIEVLSKVLASDITLVEELKLKKLKFKHVDKIIERYLNNTKIKEPSK